MEGNNGGPHPSRPRHSHEPDPAAGEFDLLALWCVLAGRWKLILASVALSITAAVVYLAAATPIYETEVILLPPEAQHVSALNIKELKEISAADIYGEFIRNLKSNSLRRQFFDQNNLGPALSSRSNRQFTDDAGVFKHLFNDRFKVKVGANNEAGFVSVSLRGEDPELIRELLNGFVVLAAKQAISEIGDGVKKQIDMEMEMLNDQVSIGRLFARELRLDRIAMLEEQLAIARELRIISRESTPLRAVAGKNIGVAVSTSEEPLYLRGVKELTAEKEVLEKRKNDDPFIEDLREKQIRLAELASGLQKLQASTNNIYAARIDQAATSPEDPVKPHKVLVMVEGLVMGGVLGIFAAFLANFIAQRRARVGGSD